MNSNNPDCFNNEKSLAKTGRNLEEETTFLIKQDSTSKTFSSLCLSPSRILQTITNMEKKTVKKCALQIPTIMVNIENKENSDCNFNTSEETSLQLLNDSVFAHLDDSLASLSSNNYCQLEKEREKCSSSNVLDQTRMDTMFFKIAEASKMLRHCCLDDEKPPWETEFINFFDDDDDDEENVVEQSSKIIETTEETDDCGSNNKTKDEENVVEKLATKQSLKIIKTTEETADNLVDCGSNKTKDEENVVEKLATKQSLKIIKTTEETADNLVDCGSNKTKDEENVVEKLATKQSLKIIKTTEEIADGEKIATELLNNLAAVLRNNESIEDKRQLGECLINSLALALNLENPLNNSCKKCLSNNKLQRSKSDSKVGGGSKAKLSSSSVFQTEFKKNVFTKASPANNTNQLKVKKDAAAVGNNKGPLKATMPVSYMAKTNRKSGVVCNKTSPPLLHHQSRRTTITPITPKLPSTMMILPPPIAQSTPELIKTDDRKTDDRRNNSLVEKLRSSFGFSPRNLRRPQSSGDLSRLNKTPSPSKNTSSIPKAQTLTRRNSASEIPISCNSSFNDEKAKPSSGSCSIKINSLLQKKTQIAGSKEK